MLYLTKEFVAYEFEFEETRELTVKCTLTQTGNLLQVVCISILLHMTKHTMLIENDKKIVTGKGIKNYLWLTLASILMA